MYDTVTVSFFRNNEQKWFEKQEFEPVSSLIDS